jgi:hypothetical protein
MAELTQFKYSPEAVASFYNQVKGLPEWLQRDIYDTNFKPAKKGELTEAIEQLNQIRKEEGSIEKKEKELRLLGEFQKEQMRQAAPYKLLFSLPGQITEALTLPGQIRLAGATAANQAAMRGIEVAANISAQPFAMPARPNIQYF